jgi:hypothetical protein
MVTWGTVPRSVTEVHSCICRKSAIWRKYVTRSSDRFVTKCFWLARFTVPMMMGEVKLSLCLTNQALRPEGVWGSGCIDPHFLELGSNWRWVVSFTSQPLYPRGKSPRARLDDVEKRKFLTLPGLELRLLGCPVRSQSLYRLRYSGSPWRKVWRVISSGMWCRIAC